MRETRRKAGMVTRILCAFGMFMLGLGHQMPQAADAPDYASAAYALPDGTVASLCVTVVDSDGKTLPMKPGCEVCRLAASVLLPSPDCGSWLHLDLASLQNPFAEAKSPVAAYAVERAKSRGPPVRA